MSGNGVCTTCQAALTFWESGDATTCRDCDLIAVLSHAIELALRDHEPYAFAGEYDQPEVNCSCEQWQTPSPDHLAPIAAAAALAAMDSDAAEDAMTRWLGGRWR